MEAPNNTGLGVLIRHFHICPTNEQPGLANKDLDLLLKPDPPWIYSIIFLN